MAFSLILPRQIKMKTEAIHVQVIQERIKNRLFRKKQTTLR
jgi:hypothetical protein